MQNYEQKNNMLHQDPSLRQTADNAINNKSYDAMLHSLRRNNTSTINEELPPHGDENYNENLDGNFITENDAERQEEIRQAIEEVRRRNEDAERIKLVQKLQRLAGKQTPPNISTFDISHLRRLTMEYRALRQGEVIVKLFRRMLLFTCRVIEQGVSTMDSKQKFIDLRGWAESMQIEIDMYEEHFYDIYEFYLSSLSDNPLLILSMMIITNAAQHSMERKMYAALDKIGAKSGDVQKLVSQMREDDDESLLFMSTPGLVRSPGRSNIVVQGDDDKHENSENDEKDKRINNKFSVRMDDDTKDADTTSNDDLISTISLQTNDITNN